VLSHDSSADSCPDTDFYSFPDTDLGFLMVLCGYLRSHYSKHSRSVNLDHDTVPSMGHSRNRGNSPSYSTSYSYASLGYIFPYYQWTVLRQLNLLGGAKIGKSDQKGF